MGCGSLIGISILGVIILVAVSAIISPSQNSPTSGQPQTPEEIAAKNAKDAAVQRAAAGAKVLKQSARDPDSFKLESALIIDATGVVCYEYRSRNGFGGMNRGQAVLLADGKTFKTNEMAGFVKLWNNECAGKPGTEAETAINWMVL